MKKRKTMRRRNSRKTFGGMPKPGGKGWHAIEVEGIQRAIDQHYENIQVYAKAASKTQNAMNKAHASSYRPTLEYMNALQQRMNSIDSGWHQEENELNALMTTYGDRPGVYDPRKKNVVTRSYEEWKRARAENKRERMRIQEARAASAHESNVVARPSPVETNEQPAQPEPEQTQLTEPADTDIRQLGWGDGAAAA